MDRLEHVRFRLRDLVKLVGVMDANAGGSVPEALTWYWNWAVGRGYTLVSASNQLLPHDTFTAVDGHPLGQVEILSDEIWNVVWRHGGTPEGSANLLDTPQAVFFSAVTAELRHLGWSLSRDGLFRERACGGKHFEISDIEIALATMDPAADGRSVAFIAAGLIAGAEGL